MKLINAFDGKEYRAGDMFPVPGSGVHQILKIEPGIFSARALITNLRGKPFWLPLQVRWTHPSFFLQHIAFIPT